MTIAVVGCGAISDLIHLPVIAASPDFRLAGLVDTQHDLALETASAAGDVWTASDHREAIGRVDAALLAVPNHLHAPMAVELLTAGVHVLVEKPMALCVDDCDRMIEAADDSGSVLAVGLVRRFFDANRLVADTVSGGALGGVRRVIMSEGDSYRWPMKSAFAFDAARAGGGTLTDLGVHTLDLLSWWLGSVERLEYRDDARGGVEAECHAELEFARGVRAEVLLTKLRNVPDVCRVEFEEGTLLLENAGSEPSPRVRLVTPQLEWKPAEAAEPVTRRQVFARQLADFARSVRDGRPPSVPGSEGRRSVEVLERCYRARSPLTHPWEGTGAVPAWAG